MRAPEFWNGDPRGAATRLLAPLGWLYGLGAGLDRWTSRGRNAPVPVISVGNVTVGGTGKTPTCIALARHLSARGLAVHIVSRGYGGRLAGPLRVDPRHHDAAAVGDEPLLLARGAPTWIARDRVAGARRAAAEGADLILLDDGHQHYRLRRDLSLVVVDDALWFGTGRAMPAGPLREPLTAALRRAQALVVVADPAGRSRPPPAGLPSPARLPRLDARFTLTETAGRAVRDRAVLAFAGIGRPAKFFATLEAAGARVLARYAFADHAAYAPDRVARLLEDAATLGALPVTTEKDHVRLPPEARDLVTPLPVRLSFDRPVELEAILAPVLPGTEKAVYR